MQKCLEKYVSGDWKWRTSVTEWPKISFDTCQSTAFPQLRHVFFSASFYSPQSRLFLKEFTYLGMHAGSHGL